MSATVDQWQWAISGDVGISSMTIWASMTGECPNHSHNCVPLDPSDFGRCYRLLERFPEWRKRFAKVMSRRPDWRPMVMAWAKMEKLYLRDLPTGRSEELYALMSKLRRYAK